MYSGILVLFSSYNGCYRLLDWHWLRFAIFEINETFKPQKKHPLHRDSWCEDARCLLKYRQSVMGIKGDCWEIFGQPRPFICSTGKWLLGGEIVKDYRIYAHVNSCPPIVVTLRSPLDLFLHKWILFGKCKMLLSYGICKKVQFVYKYWLSTHSITSVELSRGVIFGSWLWQEKSFAIGQRHLLINTG